MKVEMLGKRPNQQIKKAAYDCFYEKEMYKEILFFFSN
jgi:hypothetical protein